MNEKDKLLVSERINEFCKMDNFDFNPIYLVLIHDYLFKGVLENAGRFRKDDISKREKGTIMGESINYASAKNMPHELEKCFDDKQKETNYRNMDKDSVIENIGEFTAKLWKCHPFDDGNTRTISVFIQKYLQFFGFNVSNDIFKHNYSYFRRALIVANYDKPEFHIYSDITLLKKFFEKLLYDNKIYLDSYVSEDDEDERSFCVSKKNRRHK